MSFKKRIKTTIIVLIISIIILATLIVVFLCTEDTKKIFNADSVKIEKQLTSSPSQENPIVKESMFTERIVVPNQLDMSVDDNVSAEENSLDPYQYFYVASLSKNMKRSIEETFGKMPRNTLERLRYIGVLYYDYSHEIQVGSLICDESVSKELVLIFYQLYLNEYEIASVQSADVYDYDDNYSMEANNTSCFNYRVVDGSNTLSNHAFGLAVDINPVENPCISNGGAAIVPTNGVDYMDRGNKRPHMIDENDLAYQIFTSFGFSWGGNWTEKRDYMHFEKIG